MPDLKISELPDAAAVNGSEELPVVQSGVTRRMTITELLGLALNATQAELDLMVALTGGASAQIISGGSEATATNGTGVLQIGTSGGANIGIDASEIQSRSGGSGAALALNPAGGQVTHPNGTVSAPGITFINSLTTGLYYELVVGLIPTCYITVNGTNRITVPTALTIVISGGTEATASDATGEVQIGATGGVNLGLDGSEIQARNNNAASTLALNPAGGGVSIGPGPTAVADDTWSGRVVSLVAAENLVLGDVCYVNSSSKLAKADADSASTAPVQFIALASISTDATGLFGVPGGWLRDDSAYALTVGGLVYLSTTPGGITQTAPSGSGDVVQVIGQAYSADILWFNPSLVFAEVA